jgi:hypothetical protein
MVGARLEEDRIVSREPSDAGLVPSPLISDLIHPLEDLRVLRDGYGR